MSFLDNSGDIILDAVLTDVGRRRMAQGNFRIMKFALGDDEIDYGIYNANHPSGSAYADLEILQTPILEAFTQVNASINYGLISFNRNDILYLPTAALNKKSTLQANAYPGDQNVVYLADSSKFNTNGINTYSLLIESTRAGPSAVLDTNNTAARYLFVETGINNNEILPTAANQATYLLNMGLDDRQFLVRYDTRFINSCYGPAANGLSFRAPAQAVASATLSVTWMSANANQNAQGIANYSEKPINGLINGLYAPTTGDDLTANFSEFTGPRGTCTALVLGMRQDLTTDHYVRYGKINQDIFSLADGTTFDYIDTIVYLQGATTNVTVQIPIRITRVSP